MGVLLGTRRLWLGLRTGLRAGMGYIPFWGLVGFIGLFFL